MTKTDKFFAVFSVVLFAAFVIYTTYITGYRYGHNECRLKIETNYNERLQEFVKMTRRAKEGCEEMRAQYEEQLAIYESAFERLRVKQPEVREVVREVARDDRPEFRNEGGVLVWEPKYPLMPSETGPPTQ